MLSIDDLRRFGANVQDGMGRCMNDESFYLEMVNMTLNEKSFDRLTDAIRSGDRKGAFEAAHALKGITGNVALTPLYEPLTEMTELLRGAVAPGAETPIDDVCRTYLDRIIKLRSSLLDAC